MLRLLLDHNPGREVPRSLLWAIYRDRSPEVVRILVEAGADLEAWDEQNERTPYGLAWRMGRPDLCELLAELGARREVGPIDELIGHAFAGDREGAQRLAAAAPERVEQLRDTYFEALHQADLFVAIGTSGVVYPAAAFVQFAAGGGARTVELNLVASDVSGDFDESREGPAGKLVPAWVDEVLAGEL